jgi:hypothetical protein
MKSLDWRLDVNSDMFSFLPIRAETFVFTATSRPVRGWGICEVPLDGQNKRVVSSDVCEVL